MPLEVCCQVFGDQFNTLRQRQNGRHFADAIFKCIFLNETEWISLKISLKFVPTGPINNIPALVRIMAWRCPGDKPLSEPMIVYRRIYASLGLNELNKIISTNLLAWPSFPFSFTNRKKTLRMLSLTLALSDLFCDTETPLIQFPICCTPISVSCLLLVITRRAAVNMGKLMQ